MLFTSRRLTFQNSTIKSTYWTWWNCYFQAAWSSAHHNVHITCVRIWISNPGAQHTPLRFFKSRWVSCTCSCPFCPCYGREQTLGFLPPSLRISVSRLQDCFSIVSLSDCTVAHFGYRFYEFPMTAASSFPLTDSWVSCHTLPSVATFDFTSPVVQFSFFTSLYVFFAFLPDVSAYHMLQSLSGTFPRCQCNEWELREIWGDLIHRHPFAFD